MNFTKVQGAGNDFVLIEATGIDRDWSQMAIETCDRHYGIGSDGLLLVLPSDVADLRMRMFNPDGSEAEACGNGLRCFAKYVVEKGLVNSKAPQIMVETMAGVREVRLHKVGDKVSIIQVGMGKPKFTPGDIPLAMGQGDNIVDIKPILDYPVSVNGEELLLSFVSMGNPHAVCFYQHPVSEFPLSRVGPKIENDKLFPSRTNFEVANVINRGQIEARVWERGAGETLACGSGAGAIAVVARLHGYIENKVDIKLPGGTLNVDWDGTGEVFISGPAVIVFTGEWPSEVKF